MRTLIAPDAAAAAALHAGAALDAAPAGAEFSVALCGVSASAPLYAQLTRSERLISWDRVRGGLEDARYIARNDGALSFAMAHRVRSDSDYFEGL